MPCQPPLNYVNPTPRRAFQRPGARNVVYPPRRNVRTPFELRANNANTAPAGCQLSGSRIHEPLTLSFASLSGSGSLVGFSAYAPSGGTYDNADPSAPWNAGPVRKWTNRTLSGSLTLERYENAGLGGNLICYLPPSFPYPAAASASDAWSGTAILGAGGFSVFGVLVTSNYWENPADPYVGACAIRPAAPVAATSIYNTPNGYNTLETCTLTTRTRSGSGYAEPPSGATVQWGSLIETGAATEVLSVPDTEFAALLRAGGAVAGTLSETLPAIYTPTAPASIDPLPFADAVAVRADATFTGLDASRSHEIRAVYRARPLLGGMAYTFAGSAPAVVSGYTATVSHDLPIIPEHGVSLVSLRLVAL